MDELVKRGDGIMQFGDASHKMATSLDLTNPNNRVVLLKAMQDCDARLTENVNVPIKVCDYLAHDVEITSRETGELITVTRLVLIDDKGCTYETTGNTLLKSIQTVAYAFGPPPWNPPITMMVRTKKRGERSIYFFEVDANLQR